MTCAYFAGADRSVVAAIVVCDPSSGAGVVQRIAVRRRLAGAGFTALTGRLAGRAVVVATPAGNRRDFARLLAAIVPAHTPGQLIGVGFSQRRGSRAGACYRARSVSRAGYATLRLRPTDAAGCVPACEFQQDSQQAPPGSPGDAPAVNSWSYDFAQACVRHPTPADLVTAIITAPDGWASGEAGWVQRRQTAAARLGALTRAAWHEPASLLELAGRAARRWSGQERLADAVEAVLRGG